MSFTSPWLLWALFAASIPIIIHLVNRWRHRSVHWAAMEFLLRAARETRGTKKLLHYLILALRVLAVAALVTAFFALNRAAGGIHLCAAWPLPPVPA